MENRFGATASYRRERSSRRSSFVPREAPFQSESRQTKTASRFIPMNPMPDAEEMQPEFKSQIQSVSHARTIVERDLLAGSLLRVKEEPETDEPVRLCASTCPLQEQLSGKRKTADVKFEQSNTGNWREAKDDRQSAKGTTGARSYETTQVAEVQGLVREEVGRVWDNEAGIQAGETKNARRRRRKAERVSNSTNANDDVMQVSQNNPAMSIGDEQKNQSSEEANEEIEGAKNVASRITRRNRKRLRDPKLDVEDCSKDPFKNIVHNSFSCKQSLKQDNTGTKKGRKSSPFEEEDLKFNQKGLAGGANEKVVLSACFPQRVTRSRAKQLGNLAADAQPDRDMQNLPLLKKGSRKKIAKLTLQEEQAEEGTTASNSNEQSALDHPELFKSIESLEGSKRQKKETKLIQIAGPGVKEQHIHDAEHSKQVVEVKDFDYLADASVIKLGSNHGEDKETMQNPECSRNFSQFVGAAQAAVDCWMTVDGKTTAGSLMVPNKVPVSHLPFGMNSTSIAAEDAEQFIPQEQRARSKPCEKLALHKEGLCVGVDKSMPISLKQARVHQCGASKSIGLEVPKTACHLSAGKSKSLPHSFKIPFIKDNIEGMSSKCAIEVCCSALETNANESTDAYPAPQTKPSTNRADYSLGVICSNDVSPSENHMYVGGVFCGESQGKKQFGVDEYTGLAIPKNFYCNDNVVYAPESTKEICGSARNLTEKLMNPDATVFFPLTKGCTTELDKCLLNESLNKRNQTAQLVEGLKSKDAGVSSSISSMERSMRIKDTLRLQGCGNTITSSCKNVDFEMSGCDEIGSSFMRPSSPQIIPLFEKKKSLQSLSPLLYDGAKGTKGECLSQDPGYKNIYVTSKRGTPNLCTSEAGRPNVNVSCFSQSTSQSIEFDQIERDDCESIIRHSPMQPSPGGEMISTDEHAKDTPPNISASSELHESKKICSRKFLPSTASAAGCPDAVSRDPGNQEDDLNKMRFVLRISSPRVNGEEERESLKFSENQDGARIYNRQEHHYLLSNLQPGSKQSRLSCAQGRKVSSHNARSHRQEVKSCPTQDMLLTPPVKWRSPVSNTVNNPKQFCNNAGISEQEQPAKIDGDLVDEDLLRVAQFYQFIAEGRVNSSRRKRARSPQMDLGQSIDASRQIKNLNLSPDEANWEEDSKASKTNDKMPCHQRRFSSAQRKNVLCYNSDLQRQEGLACNTQEIHMTEPVEWRSPSPNTASRQEQIYKNNNSCSPQEEHLVEVEGHLADEDLPLLTWKSTVPKTSNGLEQIFKTTNSASPDEDHLVEGDGNLVDEADFLQAAQSYESRAQMDSGQSVNASRQTQKFDSPGESEWKEGSRASRIIDTKSMVLSERSPSYGLVQLTFSPSGLESMRQHSPYLSLTRTDGKSIVGHNLQFCRANKFRKDYSKKLDFEGFIGDQKICADIQEPCMNFSGDFELSLERKERGTLPLTPACINLYIRDSIRGKELKSPKNLDVQCFRIEEETDMDGKENKLPIVSSITKSRGSSVMFSAKKGSLSGRKVLADSSRVNQMVSTLETSQKPYNLETNMNSFLHFVQRKPIALPFANGKREVKVKALEAAEGAKQEEEKRENKRKMRRLEMAKREKEKVLQGRLKEDQCPTLREDDEAAKLPAECNAKSESECSLKNTKIMNSSSMLASINCLSNAGKSLKDVSSKVKYAAELKSKMDREKSKKQEEEQRRKEEIWRKKEADLAAKKRKREETEKKEREEKRKRFEEVQRSRKEQEERQRLELEEKEHRRKAMEMRERERKAHEEETKRQRRIEKEKEAELRRKREVDTKVAWLAEKEAERKRKEAALLRSKGLEDEQHACMDKLPGILDNLAQSAEGDLQSQFKSYAGVTCQVLRESHSQNLARRVPVVVATMDCQPNNHQNSSYAPGKSTIKLSVEKIKQADNSKSRTELGPVLALETPIQSSFRPEVDGSGQVIELAEGIQSYDISPYRSSSSDDDDDEEKPHKPIPMWARKENLMPQLMRQQHLDPDEIFSSNKTCSLEEIFGTMGSRRRRDFNRRSGSGDWLDDRVTWKEELEYKRSMGYVKQHNVPLV